MAKKTAAKKKSAGKAKSTSLAKAGKPQKPTEMQWTMFGTCEKVETGTSKPVDVTFVKPGDEGGHTLSLKILGTCSDMLGNRRMTVTVKRCKIKGKPGLRLTLEG